MFVLLSDFWHGRFFCNFRFIWGYSGNLPTNNHMQHALSMRSVCLYQKFLRNLRKDQNISNTMVLKKILLVIVIAMVGTLSALAQDVDSLQVDSTEISIDSLVVKLNTLQRNYDYLYCDLELNKAQLELKDLSNSISISSNSLLISYYQGRYDRDLYDSYSRLYESDQKALNSACKKVDAVKLLVVSKALTSNFTEQEISVITKAIGLLDSSIANVESTLRHFKVVIDAYRSLR